MLEVSQVLECKQLRGRGMPIREISRRLGIARNTVRRYLRGAEAERYCLKEPRRRPAQERVEARVRELLEEEREKETPGKQRLTGARIHRIVRKEGLEASERTVRTIVAQVRLELRDALAHAYLPLEYEPGEDAQVDFFEADVDDVEKGRTKVHVLQVRACYSRRTYRYASPNQTREALLEGLMQAFEFFGGVFTNVWFDNLTPAVRKVLKGRTRELQRKFRAFQAHYGFQAQFCRPGAGNEKGGVENEVRRSRREFFSPVPTVDGRAGVQALLDTAMEEDRTRIARGERQTVDELWGQERGKLLPLPPARFDASTTTPALVTKRSWVQTGTNFYSVPVSLVGHRVILKMFAEEVVVVTGGREVARHRRSYGNHRMVLDLEHYLPLLERKHRGLDRSVPVRQWLARVPACWPVLLRELRRRSGEVDGSKDFIATLKLCSRHGLSRTTEAVERALQSPSVSLAVIRYHLGIDEPTWR